MGEIRCSVTSCKHNEQRERCSLKSIQVGHCQTVMSDDVKNRKDTECDSFSES